VDYLDAQLEGPVLALVLVGGLGWFGYSTAKEYGLFASKPSAVASAKTANKNSPSPSQAAADEQFRWRMQQSRDAAIEEEYRRKQQQTWQDYLQAERDFRKALSNPGGNPYTPKPMKKINGEWREVIE
jgi:hypothetical protein